MKGYVIFLLLDFRYNFQNIFNIIWKSFATYGCCHPCLNTSRKLSFKYLQIYLEERDSISQSTEQLGTSEQVGTSEQIQLKSFAEDVSEKIILLKVFL